MALILFGGSFDPPHNGHLRIANAASNELFGAEVLFIPAKAPRWKITEESEDDRLAMVQKAIAPFSKFSISDYEIKEKDDISYTIKTVQYFRSLYKDETLYFLIGADEVNSFDRWKEPDLLSKTCHILYSPRPGFELKKENIARFQMRGLHFYDSGEVASHDIRNLRSVDTPDSVLKYIEDHKLYYVKKIENTIGSRRTVHSFSVAHLAEEIIRANHLTSLYGKGYIAGAIHDLGKYLSDEEGRLKALESFPDLNVKNLPSYAVHQYSGVALAKELFQITDLEILDAVKNHCTGSKSMSPLAMILYSADKIEPTRGYDSSDLIAACLHDYKEGFKSVLKANKIFLEKKTNSRIQDPLSKECFDYYLGE